MGEQTKTSFEVLTLFVKNRKLFVVNFLILCSLTAAYSLLSSKWYTATSTILPPSDDSLINLSSLIDNIPKGIAGLGLGGVTGSVNIYLAILNSRSVMEEVVHRFDLIERHKQENIEDTIRQLRGLYFITINDDGTISLSVQASTPFNPSEQDENHARNLAAEMTNFFIEALGRNHTNLKIEKAKNNRVFVETRYLQNVADLQEAENELTVFQKKSGTVALSEQTQATIQAAAELQAQIIASEIEAGVLDNTLAKDHPKRTLIDLQIEQLKDRYREFVRTPRNNASQSSGDGKDLGLYIPFSEIPDLGVQYIRLLREVRLQEKLMEFLLPLYEQAKIEEAKDTPAVQIIDVAIPPIRRSYPKRTFMVLMAGFISIIISSLIILTLEYLNKLKEKNPEAYHRLVFIQEELLADVTRAKNRILFKRK